MQLSPHRPGGYQNPDKVKYIARPLDYCDGGLYGDWDDRTPSSVVANASTGSLTIHTSEDTRDSGTRGVRNRQKEFEKHVKFEFGVT